MSTAAQRLADAVKQAKTRGALAFVSNPLDIQRFALHWLLEEIDRLDSLLRAREDDGK